MSDAGKNKNNQPGQKPGGTTPKSGDEKMKENVKSKSFSDQPVAESVGGSRSKSETYNLPRGATVGSALELVEKLKKSFPDISLLQSMETFITHSFHEEKTPKGIPFEASKDDLVMMSSCVGQDILKTGKKQGKVWKTSDGQSVTMDELLGIRKQGGRTPEKLLFDRLIELEEKDKELKVTQEKLEQNQRRLEEKEGTIVEKNNIIESNTTKIKQLEREKNELEEENKDICKKYDNEIRVLKSENDDKTKMIQQFEKQMEQYNHSCNELQKKLKASEESLELQTENFKQYSNELQEKLKASDKKCMNLSGQVKREQKTIEFMKADHEDEIRKINSQIKDLHAERDDLKHRFSKLAGDKLTDQNPDIADLSDPYRAMKLSDKFGELYDDQWTDAFEALQKKKKSTREAIDILLNVLQKCEDFFKRLREEQMDSLKNVLLHPSQDISKFGTDARKRVGGLKEHERITSADKKAMRELRRQVGVSDGVLEEVKQIFIMETKSWEEKKLLESCIPYLQKCAELCWLMVTHDPPLYMKMDVKQGDDMDLNIYNRYSSSGSTIEFLVWPALFNEKDGGLLSKGTAEPLRTVKKK